MLFFILLCIVPMMVTGLLFYINFSRTVEDKVKGYLTEMVDQIGKNISNQLLRIEYDSIDIAYNDTIQKSIRLYGDRGLQAADTSIGVGDEIIRIIVNKFSFLKDISDVLIYTESGKNIFFYGNEDNKLKLNEKYLKELIGIAKKNDGLPFWDVLREGEADRVNKGGVIKARNPRDILFIRMIKDINNGDCLGYLIMSASNELLRNIYSNIDISPSSKIFVTTDRGVVISSNDLSIKTGTTLLFEKFRGNLTDNGADKKGTTHDTILGADHFLAYSFVEKPEWFVMCAEQMSYLNKESRMIGLNVFIIAVGCFFLAVLISAIITYSISEPLKKLLKGIELTQKGDLSVKVKECADDEIALVTKNFNTMIDKIRNLVTEVKNKEKSKSRAEIKALLAQINPHFISNTLGTIKWMAEIQQAGNISDIVTSLIELLNGSMGRKGEFIQLKDELAYTRGYLNIMDYKYNSKFRTFYEIDENVMQFLIPKFTIQPIVENAIIHGIGPSEEEGLLRISIQRCNNDILISVTDNGVGIRKEVLEQYINSDLEPASQRFTSIGIKNVNERLQLYFGKEYGLTIESVVNLFTKVTIKIPMLLSEGGEELDKSHNC